jgi:hypothetical protein
MTVKEPPACTVGELVLSETSPTHAQAKPTGRMMAIAAALASPTAQSRRGRVKCFRPPFLILWMFYSSYLRTKQASNRPGLRNINLQRNPFPPQRNGCSQSVLRRRPNSELKGLGPSVGTHVGQCSVGMPTGWARNWAPTHSVIAVSVAVSRTTMALPVMLLTCDPVGLATPTTGPTETMLRV